jgi:hypothetical protein
VTEKGFLMATLTNGTFPGEKFIKSVFRTLSSREIFYRIKMAIVTYPFNKK